MLGHSCNMYRYLSMYAEPSPGSHYIKKSMVRKFTDDYANLAKAFLNRSTSL